MNLLHFALAIFAFLVAGLHLSEWSSGMPAGEFIWAWAVVGPVVIGLDCLRLAFGTRRLRMHD